MIIIIIIIKIIIIVILMIITITDLRCGVKHRCAGSQSRSLHLALFASSGNLIWIVLMVLINAAIDNAGNNYWVMMTM